MRVVLWAVGVGGVGEDGFWFYGVVGGMTAVVVVALNEVGVHIPRGRGPSRKAPSGRYAGCGIAAVMNER